MLATVLLGATSNAMVFPVKDFTKICMIVYVLGTTGRWLNANQAQT